MKEILTNEEIDALLDLFKTEGPPAGEPLLAQAEPASGGGLAWDAGAQPAAGAPPARQRTVHRFDLLRPNRFTREQIHYLDKLQGVAALAITATFAERLRLEGSCECVLVEQQRFASFLSTLREPVAAYLLDIKPLNQKGMLIVTCPLLFSAIDRILGGKGRSDDPGRDLTEVEYAVVEGLVEHVLQDLASSLAELIQVRLELAGRPRNLSLSQVVPAQDVVLTIHFQVSGELLAGDIRLVLPHAALAPALARMEGAAGGRAAEPAHRAVLEKSLRPARLGLSAELGRAELTLGDLLRFRAGDILVLGTRAGDPVEIPVEGIPKFQGVLGVRGKRYAVKIQGASQASTSGRVG